MEKVEKKSLENVHGVASALGCTLESGEARSARLKELKDFLEKLQDATPTLRQHDIDPDQLIEHLRREIDYLT